MRPRRRSVLPVTPLLLGAALAAVVRVVSGEARLAVSVALWLLVLEIGALGSAVWWWVSGQRRRAGELRQQAVDLVRMADDDARRRFVARLDHELKNPLTALLAVLGGHDEPLTAAQRSSARGQADRLRRLLDDLRRVPEAELVALDLMPYAVEQLLDDAVSAAVEDAGSSRTVRVDVPQAPRPLPPLVCDPDLISVALSNVVANALKYSSSADIVEVRAREAADEDGMLVIEVADAGPGIPTSYQQQVWEELARGPVPPGVPGSGIGLALVRTIVTRHGGRAQLRSRDGSGTSVFLHLPVAGPAARSTD